MRSAPLPPPITQAIHALTTTLKQQLDVSDALLALADAQRAALTTNRADALTDIAAKQADKLQQLATLEQRRQQLTQQLLDQLPPNPPLPTPDPSPTAPRLADLAARLPEPHRGTLLALRAQLRDRAANTQQKTAVARRAAEHLAHHVTGLVSTLQHAAAGRVTYDRPNTRPKPHNPKPTLSLSA